MESVFSGEFQRSTRMPLDAVVRLHFEGTVAYQNGFAANVSATGMFVKHPAPPPVGTQLVFEFNVGALRKPVQGGGEVVWVRDRYLGPGQPAGIGIRFSQLDAQSRDHIAEALFEYLEQSLSEEILTHADRDVEDARLATPGDYPPTPEPVPLANPPEPALSPIGTQRIDLSGLQPLPPVEATPLSNGDSPPSERYSSFSAIDSEEDQTRAIVREALSEPPLDLTGAAFVPQRGTSPWIWAALALVLVGGGYFGWHRWGKARLAEPAPQVAAAPAEPQQARPREPEPLPTVDPNRTLAETVGVEAGAPSPAAAPTTASLPGTGNEPAAPSVPTPQTGTSTAPATAATATSPPVPAATEESPAATLPRARSLRAISAREEANLTLVTLTGDGTFLPGSFSYSEIGGDNPRVLIKLKGMTTPFRGPSPSASQVLRGVRTGYHATSDGNEVHVVLDLVPSARARVSELTPEQDRLVAVLMR